jgi:hypothetical protein
MSFPDAKDREECHPHRDDKASVSVMLMSLDVHA